MNEHPIQVHHLTLVAPLRPGPRPVPTQEFLARRVLALTIGAATIGEMLAEVASYLEPEAPDSNGKCASISDALMLVGLWVCPPEAADDPPTHGLIVYPEKLVKRFPELKRVQAELEGLKLEPLRA